MPFDVTHLRIKRVIGSAEECFLCALEDEIESKYVDTYLSELVMDSSSRQKIIESRGFCNHHFYKMLISASKPGSFDGHGIALVNESIVETLIQDLHEQESHQIGDLNKLLVIENKCPACIHLSKFAKIHAKKVIELLFSGNEDFLKLLKTSKGFCIPHFITLMHAAEEVMPNQSKELVKVLLEIEEKNLRRLNSELREYIRRQSSEFSEKDRLAVADIVMKSVEKIAGRRGIKLTVKR
jgi:hypothetical protein